MMTYLRALPLPAWIYPRHPRLLLDKLQGTATAGSLAMVVGATATLNTILIGQSSFNPEASP
jgi:hypothetical protein